MFVVWCVGRLHCVFHGADTWWLWWCRSNEIGDEGAASIAQSLATNTTLTELNLW